MELWVLEQTSCVSSYRLVSHTNHQAPLSSQIQHTLQVLQIPLSSAHSLRCDTLAT